MSDHLQRQADAVNAERTEYARLLEQATEAGEAHGRAAASCYFDGNTSRETYAAVVAGLDDGDHAILDTLPAAPLSGEWADDPTPASVLADLAGTDAWDMFFTDDEAEALLGAYEDGFYDASYTEIERVARLHAPVLDASFDLETAYAVEGYAGIAWRVDVAYVDRVEAHMIGDDRTFEHDRTDLTPIADEDYCGGCGQIGCSWH